MRENIAFIINHNKKADATQIAEVLWLSQFLPKGKRQQKKPLKETTSTVQTKVRLPSDVTHEVIISKSNHHSSPKQKEKPKTQYSVIRNKNSASSYVIEMAFKPMFFPIKEQFSSLRIKQKRLSTKEIDEVKSADYIANTGIFNPVFKLEKFYEPYFTLNVLIDTNESMFLWKESIDYFIEELKYSNYFTKVQYFYFNGGEEKVDFENKASLKQEKVLNLVFTDTAGKAWRNNEMFLLLDTFSKKSFTAIVAMLPKQMWQRTSLREGESRFMKNHHFPPTNRSLRAEHAFVEENFSKSSIKIPIIPYDSSAFAYLSQVMLARKGSLIDTRIFKELEHLELEEEDTSLDAKTRVKKFFNSAQPQAKELAIYCSVLPLNNEIIKGVIHAKKLGNLDAFAEFYFAGLIDKNQKTSMGTYEFYEGVQRELLQYISIEVAKELWEILAELTAKSLGIRSGFIELLNEVKSHEPLSEKEQLIVKFLIDILAEKGRFYEKDIYNLKALNDVIDDEEDNDDWTIIYPKTNHYQMGSKDGHGDEKPVHTITFDYNFEIAKTPVTFDEYDLFCEDTKREKPSDSGWGRGRRPVINVSWHDAQAYIKWLNEQTGETYRLPTEAEWEYACRAETTTKWSFGNDEEELENYAWYNKNSDRKTHEVGLKKANPWGLFDMHGNVWEWCEDDWVDNYKNTPRDGTANEEDKKDSTKVLRGGSWYFNDDDTRSAYRFLRNPSVRLNDDGFRLLRTLP